MMYSIVFIRGHTDVYRCIYLFQSYSIQNPLYVCTIVYIYTQVGRDIICHRHTTIHLATKG